MKAVDALRELAIQSNNIIMRGSFSGDDIHEASRIMNWCITLVAELDKINGEQKADTTPAE